MILKKILFIFLITIIFSACTDIKDDIRRELNLGVKASYSNEYSIAKKHFDQVLEWDGDNQEAYLYLGRLYIGHLNYEKAMESFDRAITIDVNYGEAYRSRAQLYFLLGNRDASCKDYIMAEDLGIENLYNYTKFCR